MVAFSNQLPGLCSRTQRTYFCLLFAFTIVILPMRIVRYLLAISLLLGTMACRKEVEKIVVQVQQVDRQYSWSPSKQLLGNFNILLGVGKGPGGLYFQQPLGFAALEPKTSGALTYTQYLFRGPTDILVRLPIGPEFFVSYFDSLLYLVPNALPVMSGAGGYLRLHQLDPQALRVQRNAYSFNTFGVINTQNYLLFPYETTRRDSKNHLVLTHVTTASRNYPPKYTLQSQLIELPITGGIYPYAPQLLSAFEDYFLVDCGTEGVFKITEGGRVRQVLPPYTGVNTFYAWQGALYATLDNNRFAVSRDKGETWQIGSNGPDLRFTTLQQVGDSLVGVYHGIGSYLFTYNLDPVRQRWRIRPLKDDGLNQTDVNGLTTWGDTVYLATSSGLFKRPLSKFFESK